MVKRESGMEWLEQVLKEEYQLVTVLKQNQKGKVLHYRHKELERDLIVKVIPAENEVYSVLKSIHHPNIPQVFDVWADGDSCTVLEEYIDGVTIADILDTGAYHWRGAANVLCYVCDALQTLHNLHIIHRDIKPENIMIRNDGQVFLIDYDSARLYKPYQSKDTNFVGTVGYAAPEQFGMAQSDPRTDIFAIGVLLNIMLTGEHPSKILYRGKPRKIIEKCIQVNAESRYQTISELKKALNVFRC